MELLAVYGSYEETLVRLASEEEGAEELVASPKMWVIRRNSLRRPVCKDA